MKLTVTIDWLSVTFPRTHLHKIKAELSQWLGSWRDRIRGVNSYERACNSHTDATVAWSEDRDEMLLMLNGNSLRAIGQDNQLPLLHRLYQKYGARASRIDIAVDDHARNVEMHTIHKAAENYNYTGFRRTGRQISQDRGKDTGDTRTFGTPGKSGGLKFLCIYDKRLESNGETNAIRWEIRYYKEAADLVFTKLATCDSEEELKRSAGRCLGASIDFINRPEGQTNVSRMQRLPWWQTMLDELESAIYSVPRPKRPLQSSADWIGRCGGRILRTMHQHAKNAGDEHDFWRCFHAWLEAQETKTEQQVQDGVRLHLPIDYHRAFNLPPTSKATAN